MNFSKMTLGGTASPLHETEAMVLLRVVGDLLDDRLGAPDMGTLLVSGQDRNGRYMSVAEATLRNGPCTFNTDEGPSSANLPWYMSSNDLGEKAALSVREYPAGAFTASADECFDDWISSGIHTAARLKALTLNCNGGRFISSCYANFDKQYSHAADEVLLAIAIILTNLRPHDHRLQDSCQKVWTTISPAKTLNTVASVSCWVTEQINRSQSDELQAWRRWRRQFERIAELPDFFQDSTVVALV